MSGQTGTTTKGHVLWWNSDKYYGFILTADGAEIFFHGSASTEPVIPGGAVSFQLVDSPKGLRAIEVRSICGSAAMEMER